MDDDHASRIASDVKIPQEMDRLFIIDSLSTDVKMYASEEKTKPTDPLATAIRWLKTRKEKEKLGMGVVAAILVRRGFSDASKRRVPYTVVVLGTPSAVANYRRPRRSLPPRRIHTLYRNRPLGLQTRLQKNMCW